MTGYTIRDTAVCMTMEFPNKGSESPYRNSKYILWSVSGNRVQWRGTLMPDVAHLDALDKHLGGTYEHVCGSVIMR